MNAPLHLLLVDDNEEDRALVQRYLKYRVAGLVATEVRDEADLAAALAVGEFNFVITEQRLDWSTGLDVLARVRERFSDCPVVMFTAWGDEGAAALAMQRGLDDFVLKSPRHFEHLAAAVQQLWERRQSGANLAERRAAERGLVERERQFRAVFENALDGIVITAPDGICLEINPAACELWGLTRRQLLGRNIEQMLPSESGPDPWRELRDHGTAAGACQLPCAGGKLRDVEYLANAAYLPGQNLIVLRDVTLRRQLEQQFRQSQKMEAVGRLAGGVAHDFNNMLTIIIGYCDVIRGHLEETDPLCEYLGQIEHASQRAAGLTRQLLTFSRKQVLQPNIVDLNEVVGNLDRMLRRIIGEDMELVSSLAAKLWQVKADPGQLEQALVNLVVNARDAVAEQGLITLETSNVVLDANFTTRRPDVVPGEYVLVSVSDNGAGMTADVLTHIFEPFFTTKGSGKGTGLGLPMVYGIVKQCGGHVEVESQPGLGSTFRLYFPRSAETRAAVERPTRDTIDGPTGETVLVVEDEFSVRKLARHCLAASGYRVLEAANGEEALAVCRQHTGPIDLLLTDVVMPKLNGRQLADRLTAMQPEMKVIFMSGYTDEIVLPRGIATTDNSFLQKPFAPQALLDHVRDVLHGQTARPVLCDALS